MKSTPAPPVIYSPPPYSPNSSLTSHGVGDSLLSAVMKLTAWTLYHKNPLSARTKAAAGVDLLCWENHSSKVVILIFWKYYVYIDVKGMSGWLVWIVRVSFSAPPPPYLLWNTTSSSKRFLLWLLGLRRSRSDGGCWFVSYKEGGERSSYFFLKKGNRGKKERKKGCVNGRACAFSHDICAC